MADHAVEDDFDGDIFIYRGGRAPLHITHARIDKSLDEIENYAFNECENLVQVDTHDGIRRVGKYAFRFCSLRRINLKSAVEIGEGAFWKCENLESVEFGDTLETIGYAAFNRCTSLPHLKLTSITTIGNCAFNDCTSLIDIEFSERLQTIRTNAYKCCYRLQRIAIPLKRNLLAFNQLMQCYNQFDGCDQLTIVDLVGGVHKTVASLHIESWRTEMIAEINRINQVLPGTSAYGKTYVIQQWMYSVIDKLEYYKAEHFRYVKEAATLLELALWKTKLGENEDKFGEGKTKKAKIDAESARKERRLTCGAEIVIKNVLPFLQLK